MLITNIQLRRISKNTISVKVKKSLLFNFLMNIKKFDNYYLLT